VRPVRAPVASGFSQEIDPAVQVFRFQHLQRFVDQIPPVPRVVNLQVDTIPLAAAFTGWSDDSDRVRA